MNSDPYAETLDNPDIPFQLRWSLISEIDRTNQRLGVYLLFFKHWNTLIKSKFTSDATQSVLEVGSGSGGLSARIQEKAMEKVLMSKPIYLIPRMTFL